MITIRQLAQQMRTANDAVFATGMPTANSYLKFAQDKGFKRVVPTDMSSNRGDWSFLVSNDCLNWHSLTQSWNGKCHVCNISPEPTAFGDEELVLATINDLP